MVQIAIANVNKTDYWFLIFLPPWNIKMTNIMANTKRNKLRSRKNMP